MNEMSEQELRDLPVAVDIPTAGRAFSLGRATAYQLARAGKFPCKVLQLGSLHRVLKADILREVGMPEGDGVPVSRPENEAGDSPLPGNAGVGEAGTPVTIVIRAILYQDGDSRPT